MDKDVLHITDFPRTSRFYALCYIGEDLLFDPIKCSIHTTFHNPRLMFYLHTLCLIPCLSSVESTVGALLLVLKQLDAVLALSLQDSDLQSNALRTGRGKCKKKNGRKVMHLACVSYLFKDSKECGILHCVAFLLYVHLLVLQSIYLAL